MDMLMQLKRDSVVKDAFKLVWGAMSGLDPESFYGYVDGIGDTELFEMGYLGLANSFIEFVYETTPNTQE